MLYKIALLHRLFNVGTGIVLVILTSQLALAQKIKLVALQNRRATVVFGDSNKVLIDIKEFNDRIKKLLGRSTL